jgi:uracil phosphoribosyltransferase
MGVKRVVLISVLGSDGGVRRAAEEWSEGVELWVGV